jgi:predicted dehydrogenase
MATRTGRRQFLQQGIQGGLGATFAMSGLASPRKMEAASDKVVIGFIGVGGRGSFLLSLFLQRPDVEIAYICDVARERRDAGVKMVEAATGRQPKAVEDLRQVLDDRHVDGVVVATPDHWHAPATVMACQAGKDVYVEKPATQNIWEGRKAVEAARKYNRVVQVGMQNRSSTYGATAREHIRSGNLGDIHLVRVYNMLGRERLQKGPDTPPPDGLNWDMWLGPAAQRPFNTACRKNWYYFWDFGSGFFDDGVHQFDFARMVIDRKFPNSVHHAGGSLSFKDDAEVPDTTVATYQYDSLTIVLEQTWWTPYMVKTPEAIRQSETAYPDFYPFNGMKVEIFGTQGMMILGRHGAGWQLFDQNGQKIEQEKQTHGKMQAGHIGNYIECIRTRKQPNADIEHGHVSASCGHMANISYRLGNRKLNFDAATETFVNDEEANRYLKRTYREPWVIPDHV